MRKIQSSQVVKFILAFTLIFAISYTPNLISDISNDIASANEIQNEMRKSIGGSSGDVNTDSIVKDAKKILIAISAIGAIWAVGCIIAGGILLAGSGNNAARRTGGILMIVFAGAGVFVIYKAYDIANYFISLGS